jgi:hypothetical protein
METIAPDFSLKLPSMNKLNILSSEDVNPKLMHYSRGEDWTDKESIRCNYVREEGIYSLKTNILGWDNIYTP